MSTADRPRKPGRPKDPDLEARRRAEILDAAAKVFARDGFAAADVQHVADAAGVGKGTVYRYYPTKDALFLAAVGRGLEELEAAIDADLADPSADPLSLVERSVRTYFRFFARRPDMAELFIQERAAFPHQHRPLYFAADAECEEFHRHLFDKLVSGGQVRAMPADRFFNVLGDLLYGTILTNLMTGRPADPDAQAADVLDVLFAGILTDAERARRAAPQTEGHR